METTKYTLRDISQLDELFSAQTRDRPIEARFTFLPAVTNEAYSKKINRYRNACGCTTGKYFMAIALLLCLAGILGKASLFAGSFIATAFVSLTILLAAAVTGKITGLAVAHYKLKQAVREIRMYHKIL